MINAALELGRSRGFKAATGQTIVSGNFVKLTAGDNINPTLSLVVGDEADTGASIFGIAADDTQKIPANVALGYDVIDNWFKNGLVSAFLKGGLFSVWNDGRGAVFAEDVIGAAAGAPLYVAAGKLTATAGDAGTLGAVKVGSVIRAPIASGTYAGASGNGSSAYVGVNGVLYFKADI